MGVSCLSAEADSIEAFLTTIERAVEVHGSTGTIEWLFWHFS